MSVGNRIFLKRQMPSAETMKGFEDLPAANVADVMGRFPAMNPRIHLISKPSNPAMVGPALTVKVRSGDNLFIHEALNMASEGDIIVVSNEEDGNRSLMGEIMMIYLSKIKKAGGIVLDGPIRDFDTLSQMDFPIYATGSTPNGPYKEGPGEINTPISCGGVQINPGDIIMGDADGVIVIPRSDSEKILEDAQKYHISDDCKCEAAKNGTSDRSWVERTIAEKKVEVIDDFFRG